MANDYGLEAATVEPKQNVYGLEAATSPSVEPGGPTIGPKTTPELSFNEKMIPGWKQAKDALDKLTEWAGSTQEGKEQHPIKAAIGKHAQELREMLIGGAIGGPFKKYGMLTNPVTSSIIGAPEDEAINAARDIAKGGANLVRRGVGAVTGLREAAAGTETGRAITQTLAPEIANASLSTGRGAATTGGAATTSITPTDVLQHASDLKIRLTPAQALQTSTARSEQVLGEEALLTGPKIKAASAIEKGKLEDAVSEFQDRLDPQRVGLSSESAGEHLQNSANISKSVLKDNVDAAYDLVKEKQANLAGDVQAPLQKLIHDESFMRQPAAAVEQPVFQTSGAKAAIKDIQDMLADPAMQGRQSIQSLRNLRTTLLEKGNDYGANALSSSGQRIYKLAAGKVDSAIMDAAKGTEFEPAFREAGAQNAKLQDLYNDKSSPLYKILNTDDPAKVSDGILNRSSVHELEALKGENFDLGPLARQAIEDIKDGGFRITQGGLGGYPDTFLRSLLGPEEAKELYLKADIARRLAENYNPSGSGKVVLGAGQLIHPIGAVAAQAARLRSMPQEALNFLPKLAEETSPITGGKLASPAELFKSGTRNPLASASELEKSSTAMKKAWEIERGKPFASEAELNAYARMKKKRAGEDISGITKIMSGQ